MSAASAALAAAGVWVCARAVGATTTLTVLPQLGISREGKELQFRANQPVVWSVAKNSGSATFTQLSSTPQVLTLQAGTTGGGEYTVIARLATPACSSSTAPGATALGAQCTASCSWRILSTVQALLVAALLCFGVGAGAFNAWRMWRLSQEAHSGDKRRLVVTKL